MIQTISSNPGSAPTLLAQNLPTASNFYISYFVVFGIGTSAQMIFNVAAVAVFFILGSILDSTPRKKYLRYINISGIGWGSNYPKYTTLGVIGMLLVLLFSQIETNYTPSYCILLHSTPGPGFCMYWPATSLPCFPLRTHLHARHDRCGYPR